MPRDMTGVRFLRLVAVDYAATCLVAYHYYLVPFTISQRCIPTSPPGIRAFGRLAFSLPVATLVFFSWLVVLRGQQRRAQAPALLVPLIMTSSSCRRTCCHIPSSLLLQRACAFVTYSITTTTFHFLRFLPLFG